MRKELSKRADEMDASAEKITKPFHSIIFKCSCKKEEKSKYKFQK